MYVSRHARLDAFKHTTHKQIQDIVKRAEELAAPWTLPPGYNTKEARLARRRNSLMMGMHVSDPFASITVHARMPAPTGTAPLAPQTHCQRRFTPCIRLVCVFMGAGPRITPLTQ